MSSQSMSPLGRSVKHGIARLTASADSASSATRLTQVSHKAPMRLLPMGKSSVNKAGAAICALSNYGAGMLQGDSSELLVQVDAGARLGITTQGATRVYTQRIKAECKAQLNASLAQDSFLVYAPDPCAMFASSSFAQRQNFQLHPSSSLVLIDWFSSGRYRNGERWQFDRLKSRTTLEWIGGDNTKANIPFLQDSISMDQRIPNEDNKDPFGVAKVNSFASLILYGSQADPVVEKCQMLQEYFAAAHTSVRQQSEDPVPSPEDLQQLYGRVCFGVSKVPLMEHSIADADVYAHVVRLAATTNEDLYRVFHHLLLPLAPTFGHQFYKDRISALTSEIPRMNNNGSTSTVNGSSSPVNVSDQTTTNNASALNLDGITTMSTTPQPPLMGTAANSPAFWSAYMLADSSMPTGSFAHSAGLEAAAQMGLIQSEDDVAKFVQVATRSTLQVTAPFVIAGHQLLSKSKAKSSSPTNNDDDEFVEKWRALDQKAQAVLCSNAPACAASLDQGKSLARVALQWLDDAQSKQYVQRLSRGGHVGPILGIVSALLGLDERQVCQLFGYCAARDMVSAAVRLSLVGPLASVRLLQEVQGAAQDGLEASLLAMSESDPPNDVLSAAAACAPVVEAVHPCHELLQVRLFRT